MFKPLAIPLLDLFVVARQNVVLEASCWRHEGVLEIVNVLGLDHSLPQDRAESGGRKMLHWPSEGGVGTYEVAIQNAARLDLRRSVVDAVGDDTLFLPGDEVGVVDTDLGEGNVRLAKPSLGVLDWVVVELGGVVVTREAHLVEEALLGNIPSFHVGGTFPFGFIDAAIHGIARDVKSAGHGGLEASIGFVLNAVCGAIVPAQSDARSARATCGAQCQRDKAGMLFPYSRTRFRNAIL